MTRGRLFIAKIVLLLLPFAVPLAFPVLVLWSSGEFISQEQVIQRQSRGGDDLIVGLAFSNPWRTFKLEAALQRQPQILVLGSSRCEPIRSTWFKNPASWYNASMGVSVLWHQEEFLRRFRSHALPRLLILALDQWDFNGNSSPIDSVDPRDPYFHTAQEPLRLIQERWKEIYNLYDTGRFKISDIMNNALGGRYIGLTAMTQRAGFRNDGSRIDPAMFDVESPAPGAHDPDYKTAMERIAGGATPGSSRYEHGATISEVRVATLVSLLAFCKKNHIHVAAFMPPYAHKVIEVMRSKGDAYGYFFALNERLQPLFKQHDFTLCDFSDIQHLGFPDSEVCWSDGYHSSEKTYLKIVIELAKVDSRLRQEVDLPRLEAILAASTAPFAVHDDPR